MQTRCPFSNWAVQQSVPGSQLSWYGDGRRVLQMCCVVCGAFTPKVCWFGGKAGENSIFSFSFPMRYRFKRTVGFGEDVAKKLRSISLLLLGLDFMDWHRGRTQIRYQSNQHPLSQARYVCSTLVQGSVLLYIIFPSLSPPKSLQKQDKTKRDSSGLCPPHWTWAFAAEVPSGHTWVTHRCSS